MKILIITLEYPPVIGGIASYVYNMAKHLPAGEVVLWAPKHAGDAQFDGQNSWKTYRGRPYFNFFWPRWLRWYFQVKKIVKKEKIEHLYIQHALPGGYIGYMLKKSIGLPYTVFFHGSDMEIGLKKKFKKLSAVCRSAEKIIVNSVFLKNKLSARLDTLNNIQVIYPAAGDHFFETVDAGKVSALRSQLALQGKRVLVSVGRFVEGKGFPHLIRMMPRIIEQVPNATLLLIGDGAKKQVILDAIQKNGLQNSVRYLGYINNEDLPYYYALGDAFILLTHRDEKTEEGWGTVYVEAAACGLPVIAGNVGGVEEAVENMKTGFLVDSYQENQVVNTTAELLKNAEFAKSMGEAGRKRAKECFDWEKQIKLLVG
jgi:phosphatidyl-myo-inositol dimannoside synthase